MTLRGWVVIVGFFTIVVLVIYRDLAAPKATQPYFVQKALGTWEKICNHPSVHAEAARRLRNHARLDKKILGGKTWPIRLGCWADTRVRVSARWRKLVGKN